MSKPRVALTNRELSAAKLELSTLMVGIGSSQPNVIKIINPHESQYVKTAAPPPLPRHCQLHKADEYLARMKETGENEDDESTLTQELFAHWEEYRDLRPNAFEQELPLKGLYWTNNESFQQFTCPINLHIKLYTFTTLNSWGTIICMQQYLTAITY